MGPKINELVSEVKRSITFENLFNKKIAIDAFNTSYNGDRQTGHSSPRVIFNNNFLIKPNFKIILGRQI